MPNAHTAWTHVDRLLLEACRNPATRADIAASTGLPKDTIHTQLAPLINAGLIHAGPGPSGFRHELTYAGKTQLLILSRYGQQAA